MSLPSPKVSYVHLASTVSPCLVSVLRPSSSYSVVRVMSLVVGHSGDVAKVLVRVVDRAMVRVLDHVFWPRLSKV
ncbi:hypothetical protein OHB49_00265 [Streptomyces sp. NBC_01717]|uniref:hypothetical protein n=1 Tax=Streptomyces sp. NBC_01717 TaxID=2975918 RepID=UPI002E2F3248|nr:hypothetical protein [Streptomyces sp. NBC_01717]